MSYRLWRQDVLFLQRLLVASGFDPGELDGIWGPRTNAAEQEFLEQAAKVRENFPQIDSRTDRNIESLILPVHHHARSFMQRTVSFPYTVKIISGTRSYEEQNRLYRQGRTQPGPRVTRARGGRSWHNFGVAWDVGLFENGRYMNGSEAHDNDAYDELAALVLEDPIEWGGHWIGFRDRPHYQVKIEGKTIRDVRRLFEAGTPFI